MSNLTNKTTGNITQGIIWRRVLRKKKSRLFQINIFKSQKLITQIKKKGKSNIGLELGEWMRASTRGTPSLQQLIGEIKILEGSQQMK